MPDSNNQETRCPRCQAFARGIEQIEANFGYRNCRLPSGEVVRRVQSHCRECRRVDSARRRQQADALSPSTAATVTPPRLSPGSANYYAEYVARAQEILNSPQQQSALRQAAEQLVNTVDQQLINDLRSGTIPAVDTGRFATPWVQQQETAPRIRRRTGDLPPTTPVVLNLQPKPNSTALFTYSKNISVELEGAFAPRCQHDCAASSSCTALVCNHRCADSNCPRTCQHNNCCSACTHRHQNSCYLCEHLHVDACRQVVCSHAHRNTCARPYYDGWSSDASVNSNGNLSDRYPGALMGEVKCNSPKYYPDMQQLLLWCQQNAPIGVDKTCGTHFHIAMRNDADYKILADNYMQFHAYFIQRVTEWADQNVTSQTIRGWLNDRLTGRNRYCCLPTPDGVLCPNGHGDSHKPSEQMPERYGNSSRYCHINYSKAKHGTIEFRVFHGMKTPELIVSAGTVVVQAVEDYLAAYHAAITANQAELAVQLTI